MTPCHGLELHLLIVGGLENRHLQPLAVKRNLEKVGAEGDEGLFEPRSFRLPLSLSLVESVDDIGCRLKGACNPMAVKFEELLSQGEVEGVMNGVEGSLFVGDQPVDSLLLHELHFFQQFIYFWSGRNLKRKQMVVIAIILPLSLQMRKSYRS